MSKGKKSGVLLGVLLAAGSLTTMVFAEEEKVADSSFPLVAEKIYRSPAAFFPFVPVPRARIARWGY